MTRDELVAHVAELSAATDLPLNVDSERCYPDDPGGVAETVTSARRGGRGRAARSRTTTRRRARSTTSALAAERVAEAAEAAHGLAEPMVLTGRAENHIRGVDDLDDTIARLIAYRDAGADCVYAPGLTDIEDIKRVVEAVGVPVNVLALATAPPIPQLAAAGVRRVSTGSLLAGAAYGALHAAAQELLDAGTSNYAARHIPRDVLRDALG